MRKALIVEGKVHEVVDAEPFPPFHPSLTFVECGPEIGDGWLYDGVVFSAPPPSPETAITRQSPTPAQQIVDKLVDKGLLTAEDAAELTLSQGPK